MAVLYFVLLCVGAYEFGVVTGDSCDKRNIHYLANFTIPNSIKNQVISKKECSNSCRNDLLCTHWSWSSIIKACYLKYISPGTPPQQTFETSSEFISGERFCGSLVSAVCPNKIPGQAWKGSEKWLSYSYTFNKCKNECGAKFKGKIYITRRIRAKDDEEEGCWCEMINNSVIKDEDDFQICTLPARDPPRNVCIFQKAAKKRIRNKRCPPRRVHSSDQGTPALTAGEEALFECQFSWSHKVSEYPVPSIDFQITSTSNYTKPFVSKIHLHSIPRVKHLDFLCIIGNSNGQNIETKKMTVEWNEIIQISGNQSPMPDSSETYSCNVDAHPLPRITWNVTDINGITVYSSSKLDAKKISLKFEKEHSNITLTCFSNIDDNTALHVSKKIQIMVTETKQESASFIGSLLGPGLSFFFVLLTIMIIYFTVKKFRQKRQENPTVSMAYLANTTSDDYIPKHIVLKKDADLQETLTKITKHKDEIKAEFKTLENFISKEIKETFTIATTENNALHNRYKDILPYDSNTVMLSKATGTPKTTYFNASIIQFSNMTKTFIAAQAPIKDSFSNFWQLIVDKKVSTILMITGLQEGGRVKAHQYWPDVDNPEVKFNNKIKVKYESHSFPGTYYHRILKVQDANGRQRKVNHVQTTAWLDSMAPKDSKILLDLVYQIQELDENKPDDPILVHCSSGVGRTGTFLAVYKLIADYHNDEVEEIDVFSTVVEMRRQRMKMVQRSEQYNYIIKCFKHYVMSQESVYSNV